MAVQAVAAEVFALDKGLVCCFLSGQVWKQTQRDIERERERELSTLFGVFQRPPTLVLVQKHRVIDGSRIVKQSGGVCATFRQDEGILL